MTDDRQEVATSRRRVPSAGLRGKLLLSHLAVIAFAMVVAGLALLSLVRSYLLNALEDSLQAQAELISAALLAPAGVVVQPPAESPAYNTLQQQQIANLEVQVENQIPADQIESQIPSAELLLANTASIELTSALPTRVLVIDRAGSVLFESGPHGPEGLGRSGVVSAALKGNAGRSLLRGEERDWLALALPLRQGEQLVGGLALAHPLDDLAAVLNDLESRLLLAGGAAAILSGALGLLLAGRLVQPIRGLTLAAERLAQRDYDAPVPQTGRDEIGSLSRTFASMREALRRTERTRTQFISDVSHEMRTPLTGIKGLVETLQDGAVEDQEVRDRFLASINSETERLIRLTEDLLTLTRADEHALELRIERIDLSTLVQSTLDRLRPDAEKLRIGLDFSYQQVPLRVEVDPDRVEQVLLNLLDNALKHAPSGTDLEVQLVPVSGFELAAMHAMQSEGSAPDLRGRDAAQGWALVRVRDQGPGIPPESLDRVFDRFYRADPARDRDRGGSGLGLSIARALIDLHGGLLWVESPLPDWPGDGPPGTQACFAIPRV